MIYAMSRLHLAAMRGLAIERLFEADNEAIDEAFDLLSWYKDRFVTRLTES
ncbi:hypothetical protein H5J25_02955 [Sphingomonas aliaeris]|uniref:Uncharacterized protein n=1 Tax=Sphingomonas aliaeris TaxID=2759526 RepID=A0A974S566_9SPHN|nr:hypothetical protein [Sphingomonas aliaeris]QQV77755.1 hypothetical protein H5J25_02955 [Sphingomonas aliaeris]